MLAVYSGTYEDDRAGREDIEIESDGSGLRTVIRGIEFTGRSFDDWSMTRPAIDRSEIGPPADPASSPAAHRSFRFNGDELCDCRLTARIPIELAAQAGQRRRAWLGLDLQLGAPTASGGIDSERLSLALSFAEGPEAAAASPIARSAAVDSFEDALIQIRRQLAPAYDLRCCFACGLSDYFPGGNGIFGEMACFRNIPEEYVRSGDDKHALLKIFDRRAGDVQETWVCSEFRPRNPGAGYRG
ncbi:MAG: DUF6304 family protein [bacterium]|nr:DUF6304 family protein [bacterium]